MPESAPTTGGQTIQVQKLMAVPKVPPVRIHRAIMTGDLADQISPINLADEAAALASRVMKQVTPIAR